MVNETDTQSIENAAREFEGTILFPTRLSTKIKTLAAYGNYLLYKDEQGKSVFMTIMEIEHDPLNGTHFIRAEDAGMDLLNGYVGPYKATKAMTFKQYFDVFAKGTGFTIGINEITDLSRTLEWESEEQTILARMLSVATQFDNAEIAFSFTITGTQVVQRRLDVMRKRGADNRIILYANRDINNIVTKGNIYDLATALEVSGGEIDGVPVTLKGYSYTDPTGRFELDPATGILYDTESVKVWSRLLSNDNPNPENGYIKRLKSYETTNKKTLLDNAIRELTKVSQPIVNYETDISKLPDNVLIGDTVYLSDENQELYLSARVLTLDRCYSEETYTATLGDYLIVEDGLALSLKEIAAQLKAETTYLWIRYADDDQGSGMSPSPSGKEYIAIKSVVGVPTASDDPDDYIGLWQKFVGDQGIPGPQGPNGATTYTWLKYADDDQGSGMSDDPAGKMYIGLATNKTTPTESTNPADYKWQLVKGEDGQDAHVYQAYAFDETGTDRFTIPYPNENIILNSQFKNGTTGWLTGNASVEVDTTNKLDGLNSMKVGLNADSTAGTASRAFYRYNGETGLVPSSGSLWLKADKDVKIGIRTDGGTKTGSYNVTTEWQRFEIPKDGYMVLIWAFSSCVLWVAKPKVENSSVTTIYTPAPSEDFANAYPTFMGTYATFDDTQSTDPADYTWARMLGNSGVGIKTTVVEYAVGTSATTAPTSGWQATPPAVGTNQYLWTRITLTYDDESVVTSYSVGARGAQGPQGPTGPSGNGIDTSVVTYAAGTTGTTAPATGWQATPPTVAANQFLWTKIVLTYTDGSSTTSYAVGKMGAQGPQGAKGDTGPQGPTGPTGNGISSSTISYAASTSGTTAPSTGWQGTPPTVAANSYLWTRVIINYTDGSSSTSYSVGKMGAQGPQGNAGAQGPQGPTGNGIDTSVVTYAASASGTTAPSTGWATTPPTVAANQFLWTKVVITYTNGTSTTAYSVGKMGAQGPQGAKGDTGPQGPTGPTGNGIANSTIHYAASTSGTTAPSTGWQTTPPTVAANSFLWTRVVINYTDGTSSTSYSVGKMGAQGPQGNAGAQGPQGPTGNGISSSAVNYAASASGTTAPTSGWATTPPTVAANQFLWTRVIITYTNGNTTTAYSVGKMGAQGPKGDTGAQGPKGPQGPQGPQGIQGVAYLSPTQPSTTQNGSQWFKTVSTTNRTVTDIYTYVTGSGWVKTPLAAGTLAVTSISAISANLGDITAGTINGVSITGAGLYSDFDRANVSGGTVWTKGKLTMANGRFRNDFQEYTKSSGTVTRNGFSELTHEALTMASFNGTQTTTVDRYLQINPFRINMIDSQGRGGNLTFQDLYSLGKIGIPAGSGWRQYNTSSSSGNFPSATRVGRVVQLAGAFAPNAAKPSGTENEVMGTLPVGYRPDSDCNFICQGTRANIYLLVVKANGQLMFNRYRGDTGSSNNYKFDYKDCTEGAWINIACTFAAADV
jgi:hypothetical protein